MEHSAMAYQLIYSLKKLNLNDRDDLNKTLPSESSKCAPGTPSSAVVYCTDLKKKHKHRVRITPYTPKASIRARKSLDF